MNTDFVIKRHDNDFSVVKRVIIPNEAVKAAMEIVKKADEVKSERFGSSAHMDAEMSLDLAKEIHGETVARALLSIAGDQT